MKQGSISKRYEGRRLFPLDGLMRRIVRGGRLVVVDARGRRHEFGRSGAGGRVVIRFHDRLLPYKILARPSLAFGEAYMDGRLTVESGTIRDLLSIVTSNLDALDRLPLRSVFNAIAAWPLLRRRNGRRRARANVAHHYDLSGELYRLFLDEDRQYSCAHFPRGNETLEEAQAAKKRHLAAKLLLRPGNRVLDIGSGWGGLALELARREAVTVRGITLSAEQVAAARLRSEQDNLADRVEFDLTDFRDIGEQYDRIVSVGMFEHVGTAHYDEFFAAVARSLKRDGVAVIHSIGRRAPPGGMDPWITKYIFPGSYVPSLSEVLPAVERSGLWATDIEIMRLHYAETLKRWYERFQAHRDEAKALYDERFCRMWEFYLAASEMMFRNGQLMVFQIQLAHEREAVPLIRDYVTDYDRRIERPGQTAANQTVADAIRRRPAATARVRERAE